MPRSDGTLVRGIPAFDKLIPHIMSRRCDSTNYAKIEINITNLHNFLNEARASGQKIGIMDAIITAFAFMLKKQPEVNRFVANHKVYQRNHVCVSFTMLKRGVDEVIETAVKVYIEPDDNLFSISQKVRDVIKKNEQPEVKSAMDVFVNQIMSLPFLPGFLVGGIRVLDRFGLLPKSIIKLSPFHSSLFISNLASIKMDYIYHHLFEFGTNSLFATIGKPKRDGEKRTITLGISTDDRICTGAVWAKAFYEFKKCIENPALYMQ